MKGKYKNKIPVFLFLLAPIFYCSCNHGKEQIREDIQAKTNVTIVHPFVQDISEYIQLNGVTVFQKKDNIRSNTVGYITSLKFKQGDFIHAGQVFCTIGTKEQEALKNITSLDSSLAKFQHPLQVISNVTGVITSISTLQGDYVSEGDVLAAVSEPSSLIVTVNVPYEYNKYVGAGQICQVILSDGHTFQSAISGVMPVVDAVSQSQSFYIRLPEKLLPENLNVTIHIPYKEKLKALCVPTSAVQTDEMQQSFWLMKIIRDTLAVKIPIKTGLQNDSLTEIISDKIKAGDTIILLGAYNLADSSLVTFEK